MLYKTYGVLADKSKLDKEIRDDVHQKVASYVPKPKVFHQSAYWDNRTAGTFELTIKGIFHFDGKALFKLRSQPALSDYTTLLIEHITSEHLYIVYDFIMNFRMHYISIFFRLSVQYLFCMFLKDVRWEKTKISQWPICSSVFKGTIIYIYL